jgi:hypothetical protein
VRGTRDWFCRPVEVFNRAETACEGVLALAIGKNIIGAVASACLVWREAQSLLLPCKFAKATSGESRKQPHNFFHFVTTSLILETTILPSSRIMMPTKICDMTSGDDAVSCSAQTMRKSLDRHTVEGSSDFASLGLVEVSWFGGLPLHDADEEPVATPLC